MSIVGGELLSDLGDLFTEGLIPLLSSRECTPCLMFGELSMDRRGRVRQKLPGLGSVSETIDRMGKDRKPEINTTFKGGRD